MNSFPLIHVLFWIAMMCAPHGTSKITIMAQDQSMIWTKQDSVWIQSADQSVWKIDGTNVARTSGTTTDQHDVSAFVGGIKEQDWGKSPSLKLGPMTTLTKTGDSFVYTLNVGDSTEQRLTISFK